MPGLTGLSRYVTRRVSGRPNRWRAACRDTPRATAMWFHDLPCARAVSTASRSRASSARMASDAAAIARSSSVSSASAVAGSSSSASCSKRSAARSISSSVCRMTIASSPEERMESWTQRHGVDDHRVVSIARRPHRASAPARRSAPRRYTLSIGQGQDANQSSVRRGIRLGDGPPCLVFVVVVSRRRGRKNRASTWECSVPA